MLVNDFNGKPLKPEAQQRVAEYLREAITDAYKTENRLGLSIEGEIIDSYSTFQVAAVMRAQLGEVYIGSEWDGRSAKQIIGGWAQRLRKSVDIAHGR